MSRRTPSRSLLSAAALTAALAATLLGGAPASAGGPGNGTSRAITAADADTPESVLQRARATVAPRPGERATPVDRAEATTLMRDLFTALPDLDADDRALAEVILARPTDGASDPQGNGYAVPSVKSCTERVCLHHVRTTGDAPRTATWPGYALKTLDRVYRFQVGKLGFRRPVTDRSRGGNAKFDVYLKDLGTGLYGYCVPEYYKPGNRKVASGYCVVDNDFAATQFAGKPADNLKVTLAHEFFHAVQFAYDFTEDPWLMESTATWMEERFADDINDNRQYLPLGQGRQPHIPLDTFNSPGEPPIQYGNWTFWEFLSERRGAKVVREVWQRADANDGRPDQYSVQALRNTLRSRGGLAKAYTAYAAANLVPARSYSEGKAWPRAETRGDAVLGTSTRAQRWAARVDHLASASFAVRPDSTMGKRWKLRVLVSGPARSSAPGAQVTVLLKGGKVRRSPVALDRKGRGKVVVVPFSARRVRTVYLTVANASTRFRCDRGTTFACSGVAKHDGRRYTVQAATFR